MGWCSRINKLYKTSTKLSGNDYKTAFCFRFPKRKMSKMEKKTKGEKLYLACVWNNWSDMVTKFSQFSHFCWRKKEHKVNEQFFLLYTSRQFLYQHTIFTLYCNTLHNKHSNSPDKYLTNFSTYTVWSLKKLLKWFKISTAQHAWQSAQTACCMPYTQPGMVKAQTLGS